jgi:hypothetical protein
MPIAGVEANIADLGGNLRVVVASDTPTGPVAAAILVWLPVADSGQVSTQNQRYRDAFDVMMKTVNAAVTPDQQETVAGALGLTTTAPPFPVGATAETTLAPQRYRLRAVQPEGQSEPDTMIAVTQLA